MKRNRLILIFFIAFSLLLGCENEKIKFNFSGRKVLYSSALYDKVELVLINLDTNEEIKFNDFDEVEGSSFILFNEGKSIFYAESFDSPEQVYIYDILKDKMNKVSILAKNDFMLDFHDVSIFNDNFYYASNNKIIVQSLDNYKFIREYETDSTISNFAVYDENIIALNYFKSLDHKIIPSDIYLCNFKDDSYITIPYLAYLQDWSKDRKKLLFTSKGLKLLEYPSCEVYSIDRIIKDSLEIYRMSVAFTGNDEIIFSGFKKNDKYQITNLYLLNLQTEEIEQLTNTETDKEIKSTSY